MPKKDQFMTTECHNCRSIWSVGTEEYEWQQCDACGWKPGDPIDHDEDDLDSDEDFYDEEN